ncbi:MAG: hypothetical protein A2X96_06670 [Syntrophobacterales bacterium GWC2_56_13]|nr:MAG: hypothetical protein A2X96_06670 [Syntrophobacterales bacterium GWC2_56_13]
MLLNIAGGDCVEDLGKVQKDDGFCRILRRVEQQGMKRRERQAGSCHRGILGRMPLGGGS